MEILLVLTDPKPQLFALKFPELSRATSVLTVFELVALLARIVAAFTAVAVEPPTLTTVVVLPTEVTLPIRFGIVVQVVALPFSAALTVTKVGLSPVFRL